MPLAIRARCCDLPADDLFRQVFAPEQLTALPMLPLLLLMRGPAKRHGTPVEHAAVMD